MTTSNEISPLLSLSPKPLSSLQPHHRRSSFEAGFPLITAENLANVQDPEPDVVTSSCLCQGLGCHCAVSFTLLLSAVGAGTLAVPYTFVLLSPTQALLVLCAVGMAMAFTADTLVDIYVGVATDNLAKPQPIRESYQHLAWTAGGKGLARVTGALTAFAVFGACVGCVCVVKDMAPIILSTLMPNFDTKSREDRQHAVRIAVWIVVLIVVLPLGCLTKLSALRFSSYFGVACSIYLVGAVAYRAAVGTTETSPLYAAGTSEAEPENGASLFWRVSEVVGIYNFTFMLHLNVIPLLAQLVAAEMARKNRTLDNSIEVLGSTEVFGTVLRSARLIMQRHLAMAIGTCILLYAIFGLCAVKIYGRQTQGNILLNLSNDRIMAVPRVATLLTILLSFPLLFHPLRSLVLEVYVACASRNVDKYKHDKSALTPSRVVQAIVTVFLLVSQVLCALRVPGIQVVFSFVGASILLMLCYLFPLVFYIRLAPWRSHYMKRTRLALLILTGLLATIFCVTATFQVLLQT